MCKKIFWMKTQYKRIHYINMSTDFGLEFAPFRVQVLFKNPIRNYISLNDFESSKSFSKTLPVSTKLIQRMDVSIRLSYLKYFFSLLLINSLTERTNSWRNFKIFLIQCIYIIAIKLFHDLILHISNNCMLDFITNLLRLFLIFFIGIERVF